MWRHFLCKSYFNKLNFFCRDINWFVSYFFYWWNDLISSFNFCVFADFDFLNCDFNNFRVWFFRTLKLVRFFELSHKIFWECKAKIKLCTPYMQLQSCFLHFRFQRKIMMFLKTHKSRNSAARKLCSGELKNCPKLKKMIVFTVSNYLTVYFEGPYEGSL
jgi:hypothetical protein